MTGGRQLAAVVGVGEDPAAAANRQRIPTDAGLTETRARTLLALSVLRQRFDLSDPNVRVLERVLLGDDLGELASEVAR